MSRMGSAEDAMPDHAPIVGEQPAATRRYRGDATVVGCRREVGKRRTLDDQHAIAGAADGRRQGKPRQATAENNQVLPLADFHLIVLLRRRGDVPCPTA